MMNEDEQYIHDLLTDIGFQVHKIPETNDSKTADFIISYNNISVIAELKTKKDSIEFITNEKRLLSENKYHLHVDTTESSNRFAGLVRDSVNQIKSIKNSSGSYIFSVAIFLLDEPYSSDKKEKLVNTLYGRKLILPMNTTKYQPCYCYYCTFSSFYNYKDVLNGAFIVYQDKMSICVNNKADNYQLFIECGFLNLFNGKLLDPNEEIKNGKAISIDEEIDRKNSQIIQKYLSDKLNVQNVVICDFPSITASTLIK